jgi:alpha-N-acetylglucosamine transferase
MSPQKRQAPRQPTGQGIHYAFVTFLMRNDSYLPGALLLAYALRKQNVRADLVCMVSDGISRSAHYALGLLFDHVVDVEQIFVPHKRRQKRQDRPYMFTRLNALRLGRDGDLGYPYEKIVLLDADVLPLKRYERLLQVATPAGIINEDKSHFAEIDDDGRYVILPSVHETGTWKWHRLYEDICPHGHRIPQEITDRVRHDVQNLGINGSLFVLTPSMTEFEDIMEDVRRPEVTRLVGDLYDWPEMQYLTLRWSGRWTNVDLRYSGLNGYPCLSVLYGTHFAGFKPWYVRREKAMAHYARHDDFQLWFREYIDMVTGGYPQLLKVKRLQRLLEAAQALYLTG